jgi:hypothetical protein
MLNCERIQRFLELGKKMLDFFLWDLDIGIYFEVWILKFGFILINTITF